MTNEILNSSRLKTRGLGRGLSALLDDPSSNQEKSSLTRSDALSHGQALVPIDIIHPNKDQPRTQFSKSELDELAQSLKEKGMIQPIIVRPHPQILGQYQIIAGERRWRAAQIAGLLEIPVTIKQIDDAELLELALIENVQRQDLNSIEEARSLQNLIEIHGYTQEKLAKMLGKSRSHIANTLRLMALPHIIQNWILDGTLSAGHARTLIGKEDAVLLAQHIIDNELNVRQAENLSLNSLNPKTIKVKANKDADTLALIDRLSQALGMKVMLHDKQGKGQVRIDYKSLEELDFLIATLTKNHRI